MKTKPTTMRFTEQDLQAIEQVRQLYACNSAIAAVRLALQIAVRQGQTPPYPPKKGTAIHPPHE
jgi:dTDP-4-amino-4,6-dideoxygalactose transaminase